MLKVVSPPDVFHGGPNTPEIRQMPPHGQALCKRTDLPKGRTGEQGELTPTAHGSMSYSAIWHTENGTFVRLPQQGHFRITNPIRRAETLGPTQ